MILPYPKGGLIVGPVLRGPTNFSENAASVTANEITGCFLT